MRIALFVTCAASSHSAGGETRRGRSAAAPNIGDATRTIRAKRAAVVAEVVDRGELREAGREVKAQAIATTGTLVLDGSAGQGRRATSLVPDHHLCVVRSAQVAETVPEAANPLIATRPLTWISGPSATSDIELRRVEGVHGPRRLEVLLVEDGAPD